MTTRIDLLVCFVLPLIGSCAPTAPHAGQPTVQGQSMEHMLSDVLAIRTFVYGSGNQSDAEKSAADLVSWSQRITELFPPGQASTDYVDMRPERVANASAAMTRNAQLLLTAVQSGDRQAIGTQLSRTEHDGCGACHLSGSH